MFQIALSKGFPTHVPIYSPPTGHWMGTNVATVALTTGNAPCGHQRRRPREISKSSQELYVLTLVQSLLFFMVSMVSSTWLSEELNVSAAVQCMSGRELKQN